MARIDPEKKVTVALLLAAGTSVRSAAEQAEVGVGTVRAWRRRPEFAAAVEELQQIVREQRGRTGAEVFAAASRVLDRVRGPVPGPVRVSIPAGTSPRKARQMVARAVARVVAEQVKP